MQKHIACLAHNANLVLARTDTLLLLGATELLLAILLLLALLAAHNESRGLRMARPNEAMLGLVLLGSVDTVVGQREAGALATTEAGLHAKNNGCLCNSLVALGLGEILGDHVLKHLLIGSGQARVVDVQNHLTALKQPVVRSLRGRIVTVPLVDMLSWDPPC